MMDEVKGLSAGMRFALTRQLAARCVVLMAYVLAGYCVPWLWGLILALVSGGHYVVEYHVLGPTLVMCAVLTAVLAVSGFRSLNPWAWAGPCISGPRCSPIFASPLPARWS